MNEPTLPDELIMREAKASAELAMGDGARTVSMNELKLKIVEVPDERITQELLTQSDPSLQDGDLLITEGDSGRLIGWVPVRARPVLCKHLNKGMVERFFYWTDPHGCPDDDGLYLSPCADDDGRAIRTLVPAEPSND